MNKCVVNFQHVYGDEILVDGLGEVNNQLPKKTLVAVYVFVGMCLTCMRACVSVCGGRHHNHTIRRYRAHPYILSTI